MNNNAIFNKNCTRFNGQTHLMKSKCESTTKSAKHADHQLKVDDKQEEITLINPTKPNDSTYRKANCVGTVKSVKSITECINNGQLGELTVGDQTDDSGKETASESSEPIVSSNSTKSFDLNSSQSSSSYSTENEDGSIKRKCMSKDCKKVTSNEYSGKKECLNKDYSSNKKNCSANAEPFLLHHSSDQKNEKLKKLFPQTNSDRLDRTAKLSRSNGGESDESRTDNANKFDTFSRASHKSIESNNALNKSIRIFESNCSKLEPKANKFIRLADAERLDELDETKVEETATKEISTNQTVETIVSKTPPANLPDSTVANDSTADQEAKDIDHRTIDQTDSAKEINKGEPPADLSKDIPVPPPMPQSLSNESSSTSSILIRTSIEKKTVANAPKITFIPPQFASPPETDTNIKPSEYLKKVANFKNMKKIKLAQQRFKDDASSASDCIKRSSSENHLLVNARKGKLNQSASSSNVANELQDDELNDPNEDLQLDDDTEDELAEHQYEISKPSAVELKLQLDKTLIGSNLSRRSSMKVKLSTLEQDEHSDAIKKKMNLSLTSSTSNTASISSSINSSIGSSISSSSSNTSTTNSTSGSTSFGVTEEQLKTIFLKKTPIKKPESKTFNSSGGKLIFF